MNEVALKELLFKMADDQLILGHRNSEWTGLGPLLEEDIAFSSMAQDKIGHSFALYQLLEGLGEQDPDTTAFLRNVDQFHNCQMVELPIGEYSFSLLRHFLFDTAEWIRFDELTKSTYTPLAELAVKIRAELKYHTMHGRTWVKKLGSATEESIGRLQADLNTLLPFALGMFEKSPFEEELIQGGLFSGEQNLQSKWWDKIMEGLEQTKLTIPSRETITPVYGGRVGIHTEHLQPLIDEMTEVIRIDPNAEW